jgi:hypothetical protein
MRSVAQSGLKSIAQGLPWARQAGSAWNHEEKSVVPVGRLKPFRFAPSDPDRLLRFDLVDLLNRSFNLHEGFSQRRT